MARMNDGGGSASFGSGLGAAVGSIAKAAKKTGSATAKQASLKKKRAIGNGLSRGGQPLVNAVNRLGSQTAKRAYQPVRNQSPQRNYQPVQRAAASPQRNFMGGPAGGGGSAPRPPVGNTPSGTIAASVPPTPAPVSVEDFLAKDTAYTSQQSAYQKALADYTTQMNAEKAKYNGEYDAGIKQLGLDRTEGVTNLRDDYASRGLINSGVYGDALGDLNSKFDTSQADMTRAQQAYLSDLVTGQTNFKTTQQALLEKARQEALQRRLDGMAG